MAFDFVLYRFTNLPPIFQIKAFLCGFLIWNELSRVLGVALIIPGGCPLGKLARPKRGKLAPISIFPYNPIIFSSSQTLRGWSLRTWHPVQNMRSWPGPLVTFCGGRTKWVWVCDCSTLAENCFFPSFLLFSSFFPFSGPWSGPILRRIPSPPGGGVQPSKELEAG